MRDRLRCILFVRADDPRGAALDPAGAIRRGDVGAIGSDDTSALVSDRPSALVEGKLRQPHASVADAAEDEAALERLTLAGRHGDEAALLLLELVAHELDRLDASFTVNRDG